MKILLSFIILMLMCVGVQAQDVLYMKDKSRLQGKLVTLSEAEVVFELENGNTITLPAERVSRVVQGKGEEADTEAGQHFFEKHWYAGAGAVLMPNVQTNGWGGNYNQMGFGTYVSGGYRLNHWLEGGVLAGYESYDNTGSGSPIKYVPVRIEATSYLLERKQSPYVTASVGYAWTVVPNENQFLTNHEGGLGLAAGVGVMLGGDWLKGKIGLEYKRQKGSYTFDWGNGNTQTTTLASQRFGVVLGMMF